MHERSGIFHFRAPMKSRFPSRPVPNEKRWDKDYKEEGKKEARKQGREGGRQKD